MRVSHMDPTQDLKFNFTDKKTKTLKSTKEHINHLRFDSNVFFSGQFLKPTGVCTGIFGVIKIVHEFKICHKFFSLFFFLLGLHRGRCFTLKKLYT